MKNIYVCNTYYHIYITLIKEIKKRSSDIILSDSIPKYKEIGKRIEECKIFNNVYYISEKEINLPSEPKLIGKFFYFNMIRKAVGKYIELNFKKYSDIILYNDWTPIGYFLNASRINYILSEDGQDVFQKYDYTPFNYTKIDKILSRLDLKVLSIGEAKYMKYIEVNNKNNLYIRDKKIVELKKNTLLENLTPNEKKEISKIFIGNNSYKSEKYDNNILILTEPLFIDKRVESEEKQIEIYSKIIEEYKNDGINIYIKPHPRDLTDYYNIVDKCFIIDKNIPIEVLNFNDDIYFNKAITITSTSLGGLNFVKDKIRLGNEYLDV